VVGVALMVGALASGLAGAQPPAAKGWVKGKGYGWIWGPNDEIGALNAITPQKVMAALAIPKQGRVRDRPRRAPGRAGEAGRGRPAG
jgi:hypothetical protein